LKEFSCDTALKNVGIAEKENSYPWERIWEQKSEAKRAAHFSWIRFWMDLETKASLSPSYRLYELEAEL
jgi:hypothetical protein